MKKSIFALAGLALAMASCSNDDLQSSAGPDGITFAVTLPSELGSRAFGEAQSAKKLSYAIYEVNGTESKYVYSQEDIDGGPTFNVTMNVVKGKTYDFVFWADNGSSSPYTFNAETNTITVSYDDAKVNDDTRDAFFNAVRGVTITGPMQREVELRRPFAQINVGTSDLAAAEAVGVELATTAVKVSGAHNSLNLLTGVASGAEDAIFAAAGPASEESFPYQPDTYSYLAMAYVLTGTEPESNDIQNAQSELFDVDVTLNLEDGHAIEIPVKNTPVRRNYRTNIYGALLTSPFDWTITIEPGVNDPDIEHEVVPEGKITVNGKYYETLAEALNEATGETPELTFGAGEFTLPSSLTAEGRKGITFVGTGDTKISYPDDKDIDASGMDVAMKNVKFSTPQTSTYVGFKGAENETYEDVTFVDGSLYPMGKNVKITNSSFIVNENADTDSPSKYALRFHNRYVQTTAVISDCDFTTHLNTAVTAYNSQADITFNNCTFTNVDNSSRSATSIKDAQSAICFANATPTGEFKYNLVINNCEVTGFLGHFLSDSPLWACKTGQMCSVTIDGKSVTQPIVNPSGTKNYKLYTPSALNVIAKIINEGYYKDGVLKIDRLEGYTLTLENDIDMEGVEFTPIGKGIVSYPGKNFAGTFDGQNHTISNLKASDSTNNHAAAGLFGGLVGTVKNVILNNPTITSTHYAGGIAGFVDNETGALIDNCKVIGGSITSTSEIVNGEWDNGDKAGGILGYGCVNVDKLTNCVVEDVTIKCYRHGGAIIGYASNFDNVTGCSAKNVTMLWDSTHDYKNFGSVENAPFGTIAGNNTSDFGDNTSEGITMPK